MTTPLGFVPNPVEFWRYHIRTASLRLVGEDGEAFPFDGSVIVSGNGQWKNDPKFCHVVNHGPLPLGWYVFGLPHDSPRTGHFSIPMVPWAGNEMHGRSDFAFHGPNPAHPGESSDGCLVTEPGKLSIREHVAASGIKWCRVVAD